MANANSGTPIGVKDTAGGTFDIRPDVGRVREIEVGTKAIFNPRVLAVDFIDGAVAARDGCVAQEFMNGGNAQVSRVAVFRTLKTEREASTSHQAVGIVKAIRGAVGERKAVGVNVRVGKLNLRLDVEALW